MNATRVFLLGLSLIVVSCSTPKVSNDELIVVDLLQDLTVESNVKLSDIAKDIKYVKLESGEGHYIQQVNKYSITDNHILIYDRTQDLVLLFDREGRFLRKISNSGKGPGEYNRPNDVRISSSGEFILIHNQKQINRYDFEGKFIGYTPLPSWAIKVDSYQDGLIGFYPSTYSILMDNFTLVTFDWEGNITGQYGKRNWDWLTNGNPMKSTRFYYFDDVLNYHEDYFDTVFCLTPENEFKARIYFDCENKPLRDADKIAIPTYKRDDVKGFYRHGWVETPDHFFIQGSYDRYFHILLYEKETNLVTNFPLNEGMRSYGIPNDLDGGLPFWPGRYIDGKLYSLIDASRIKGKLDDVLIEEAEFTSQKLYEELKVFRENLSEEDGQVLTVVTLK